MVSLVEWAESNMEYFHSRHIGVHRMSSMHTLPHQNCSMIPRSPFAGRRSRMYRNPSIFSTLGYVCTPTSSSSRCGFSFASNMTTSRFHQSWLVGHFVNVTLIVFKAISAKWPSGKSPRESGHRLHGACGHRGAQHRRRNWR